MIQDSMDTSAIYGSAIVAQTVYPLCGLPYLVFLPLFFTHLLFMCYFVIRFILPKSRYSRGKRILVASCIALGIQVMAYPFTEYLLLSDTFMGYMTLSIPVMLFLNIMFSIWNKR